MTTLEKWMHSFEEDHHSDPDFNAEEISIDLAVSIGSRLKVLEINQNELAKELKVHKSYVSQILQGQNNMTILTICKIAAALNMRADIQLKDEESKSNFCEDVEKIATANASMVKIYDLNSGIWGNIGAEERTKFVDTMSATVTKPELVDTI